MMTKKHLNKIKPPDDDLAPFRGKELLPQPNTDQQVSCLQYIYVLHITRTKFPQTEKAFEYVSSEGDIMPHHNFEQGVRIYLDSSM